MLGWQTPTLSALWGDQHQLLLETSNSSSAVGHWVCWYNILLVCVVCEKIICFIVRGTFSPTLTVALILPRALLWCFICSSMCSHNLKYNNDLFILPCDVLSVYIAYVIVYVSRCPMDALNKCYTIQHILNLACDPWKWMYCCWFENFEEKCCRSDKGYLRLN